MCNVFTLHISHFEIHHVPLITSPIWRQNTPQNVTYMNQSYRVTSHICPDMAQYGPICHIYEIRPNMSHIWISYIESRPLSDDKIRPSISHIRISHILCIDVTHSTSHGTWFMYLYKEVTSPIWRRNTPQYVTYMNQSYFMWGYDSFNESCHSSTPYSTYKYDSFTRQYDSCTRHVIFYT